MIDMVEKVESWAEARNLIKGSTPKIQLLKLIEEVGELTSDINKDKLDHALIELGDVLVVATILANQLGSTLPCCFELAYDKIKNRKGKMDNGIFIKEEDIK